MADVAPRVHHCPVCGAPLKAPDGALSTACAFCGAEVKLVDPVQHHYVSPIELRVSSPSPVPVNKPAPAGPLFSEPVAKFLRNLGLSLTFLGTGFLSFPAYSLLMRQGVGTDTSVALAIVSSLLGFVLIATGRALVGTSLGLLIGIVLLVKPFVNPVRHDGRASSLTSETHLYFLVPGTLLILLFGFLFAVAVSAKKKVEQEGRASRIAALVSFGLGIAISGIIYGAPTRGEVIAQYRGEARTMRSHMQTMAANLPKPGALVPRRANLTPPPFWDEVDQTQNNTELLATSDLWGTTGSTTGSSSFFSSELPFVLHWTGPDNRMSQITMGERNSSFEKMMPRVLGARYIAAYRYQSGSADVFEVFVMDTKTDEIVAADTTKPAAGREKGRAIILGTLEAITGGTFRGR